MESGKSVSRINTLGIKSLIYQKLGHQRAQTYFHHLQGLLNLKISKTEFNKFCIKAIGRENIPLHNRLIRSILKNASAAKFPPPIRTRKPERSIKPVYGDPTVQHCPLKGRLCRSKDRPSPLGPLGKPQSITTYDESGSRQQSASELFSLDSRPPVEEGEEVEQAAESLNVQIKGPITAPFGVSFNFQTRPRTSVTGTSLSNDRLSETCHNRLELPDSRTLLNRLMKKCEMEGVNVSTNCVNLLNSGLDAYLKRLIKPSLGLAGSRNQFGTNTWHIPQTERSSQVSLQDFHTAMELNPGVLGEDWSAKLEKILVRASVEQE